MNDYFSTLHVATKEDDTVEEERKEAARLEADHATRALPHSPASAKGLRPKSQPAPSRPLPALPREASSRPNSRPNSICGGHCMPTREQGEVRSRRSSTYEFI